MTEDLNPEAEALLADLRSTIVAVRAGEKILVIAKLIVWAGEEAAEIKLSDADVAGEMEAVLDGLYVVASAIELASRRLAARIAHSPDSNGAGPSLADELSNVIPFPQDDR